MLESLCHEYVAQAETPMRPARESELAVAKLTPVMVVDAIPEVGAFTVFTNVTAGASYEKRWSADPTTSAMETANALSSPDSAGLLHSNDVPVCHETVLHLFPLGATPIAGDASSLPKLKPCTVMLAPPVVGELWFFTKVTTAAS
jgi:hypothetical protein